MSLAITMWWFGTDAKKSAISVAIFAASSILRRYILRRVFVRLERKGIFVDS